MIKLITLKNNIPNKNNKNKLNKKQSKKIEIKTL